MKKLLLIFLLLSALPVAAQTANAQNRHKECSDSIYTIFDTPPALLNPAELRSNIKVRENGRVHISIVVRANGEVAHAHCVGNLSCKCNRMIEDAVYATRSWRPATKDGRPVTAQVVMPLTLKGAPNEIDNGSHVKDLYQIFNAIVSAKLPLRPGIGSYYLEKAAGYDLKRAAKEDPKRLLFGDNKPNEWTENYLYVYELADDWYIIAYATTQVASHKDLFYTAVHYTHHDGEDTIDKVLTDPRSDAEFMANLRKWNIDVFNKPIEK